MTRVQTIYKALQDALTGPSTDPRRKGTSDDRLQYLTDAIDKALTEAEPPTYRMVFTGPQMPLDLQAGLAYAVSAIKRERIGAAVPLRKLEATIQITADMRVDPPEITGAVLTKLERH